MMLTVIVHLYATDKGIEALRSFERKVLPILHSHGGQLVTALSPSRAFGNFDPLPDEVHILNFPSEQDFQDYRDDPLHLGLATERTQAIRHTEIMLSITAAPYD